MQLWFFRINCEKTAAIAIPTSENVDFEVKSIKLHEGHRIRIMAYNQQEEVMIIQLYAPNARVSSYEKQLLMDLIGEIYINEIVAGTLTLH